MIGKEWKGMEWKKFINKLDIEIKRHKMSKEVVGKQKIWKMKI